MSRKIGLIGYGVVAQGFYQALKHNQELPVEIKKICIKDPDKKRALNPDLFTTDIQDIILDPDISIVIELIDDADAAYRIVKESLECGKAVISANKKMIAEHIEEVAAWHRIYDAPFLYEAAVAGSIPIIQNIEQFFKQQEITSLRGILNGSTNYILTRMREDQLSFEEALTLAQEKGFAESDPSLDISGKDGLHKLVILAYHAFGITASNFDHIRLESITNMEDHFYDLAAEKGLKIKSIATAYRKNGEVKLKVQPELIGSDDALFGIENEDNAIEIESSFAGQQLYAGKGAGSLPTGSAVISDLSLLLAGFRYTRQRLLVMKKSA